jgi:myo-inositol 2-dehydrogenase/D-chiro-inositol 1-dehydrogenase
LTEPLSPPASRRQFLATGAALAGAAALAPAAHAAGNDTLKIGLIGCGNRGTGAAEQALRADKNVKLTAVGDVFKDKWQDALKRLRRLDDVAKKIDVSPDNCFDGFDAYKKVLDSGVDVVLLTAPPGFRPQHFKAAVDKGVHVFTEKPMAVDAQGALQVLEAAREAKKKNKAVVAGFCYRYEKAKREWMKRVHDGDVGKIVALHCIYHANGLWHVDRKPGWDDMTFQLRNWLYYTWLSGDHIVEQACHSIDKMAWAMKDASPVKCVGTGGRQSRTDEKKYGHIFDHHAVVFEYKNGVKLYHSCRQQNGAKTETSDWVLGSDGTAEIIGQRSHVVKGKKPWSLRRRPTDADNMYQNEHDELFAGIRKGQPINDGEWMVNSTLMAIMGRMASYTGQEITWDMVLQSKEKLLPEKLAFGPLPAVSVPRPGVTKYV